MSIHSKTHQSQPYSLFQTHPPSLSLVLSRDRFLFLSFVVVVHIDVHAIIFVWSRLGRFVVVVVVVELVLVVLVVFVVE